VLHDALDLHAAESRFIVLDPRSKLAGLLALTVATALLTRLGPILASLGISLALLAASGLPIRHTAKRLLYIALFASFAFVSVLPFGGIWRALGTLIRVVACGAYVLLLSSATPSFDLVRALRFFRFPQILCDMLIFLYRYLFLFADESERMSVARKARGFEGGNSLFDRRGLGVMASSAGAVLYRAYHRGMAVSRALVARRYEGKVRTLTRFRLRTPDLAFLAFAGATILVLSVLQLGVVG